MFVRKVVLTNIGPFGQKRVSKSKGYKFSNGRHTFELNQGSIGVFGPNGVGKSTFVDAIYAALTNEFGRFAGLKADLINNKADPEKDEASIYIEVEHDGAEFELLRSLNPNKVELKVAGTKGVLNKDKAVTEALKAMGIDRRILDFCVFKRQPGSERHAIDDFLRTTPAARAEAYMALNGTEHCQAIYDVLGDVLLHDKELNAQVLDNSDELVTQLGALKAQTDALWGQAEGHEGKLLKPEHLARAKEIVSANSRLAKAEEELAELYDELNGVAAETAEARDKLTLRVKKAKAAYAAMEKLEPKVKAAEAAVAAWEKYQKTAARRKQLEQTVNELDAAAAKKKPPARPKVEDDPDVLQERLGMVRAEMQAARKVLKTFQGTGLMQCPTCGTEVAAIEDQLKAKEQILKTHPKLEAEIVADLEALQAHDADVAAYDKWLAGHNAKYLATQQELAHMEAVHQPKGSLDENKQVILDYNEAHGEAEKWEAKVNDSKTRLAKLEARQEGLLKRRDRLLQEKAKCTVEPNVLQRAKERLGEHEAASLALAEIRGTLKGLASQGAGLQAQLDKLKAQQRRTRKLRRVAKVLTVVRDAMHKQALPQRVAQGNLQLMEGDVNQNLAPFGDPFWVEADENLSFLVHKPGEPPHRAEALSGGQKVVLALAFWPAVNSLYKAGMGMMVLDEPTANLDEANILYLRKAVSHLTKQVRGKRQIIMITHAEPLKPSFDRVIELERT